MTNTNTAQLVDELTSTNDAVLGKGWVSPGLSGTGGPLSLLGSTGDPLSGLASAGVGWFTPFVSFLSDGLSQLQGGDAASVTSGSQEFGNAGQDITNLAGSYADLTRAQTTGWTGQAASDYRNAGAQHATGVAGLGTASTTVGSSIIGAGQVVAQAISDITELIGEAVGQIVPIMTQAIARAQQTFGESVVEAIPPCVGIAVEYALRIAAKLAALLASGQNLLKLVQGALGVVDMIQQGLSSISQQSTQAGTQPSAAGGATNTTGPTNAMDAADSGGTGSTAPMSADSGSSGDGSTPDGSADSNDPTGQGGLPDLSGLPDMSGSTDQGSPPDLSVGPQGLDTTSAAAPPSFLGTMPAASPYPVHADAGQPSGGGAFPAAAVEGGFVAGARSGVGLGADTVRKGRKLPSSATSTDEPDVQGAFSPVRPAGEKDKEHKRKYSVVERHDEILEAAPAVITSSPTD